ncbi:selenide, water dikinase SelD [Xylocopilactobacillus apicola]|uniref:Selenide, water dikinase n=1 Tax=Xylocopilactobacillus apicola TaxID=2932184 RepID=A0AAU9DR30_9LACO|nr:selenide, water dikinase SelD [Xylocopilactobacillus apicola]BDR57608.1 selenide, water dikinase SelD [Xylocopilactobacillus apicola]
MDEEQLFVCGGCNAKMGPGDLKNLLNDLPQNHDPRLLVGFDSTDDAAVYQLNEHLATIQTIDFFPSMVTDPYLFGQIAATNALSDIFAMGGDVLLALNIVCFPEKGSLTTLKKILAGGQEKVTEAGGVIAGGHSIHDHLPKYGLSVTGSIDPHQIICNNKVNDGDVLILTKKLGVGIITASYQAEAVSPEAFNTAVASMTMLNRDASMVMRKYSISACTDVTGFGLAGHLAEMLTGGQHQAVIEAEDLPIIPEAYACAEDLLVTAGGQRNRKFLKERIHFNFVDHALEEIVFDPQTSGGLLISVKAEDAEAMMAEMTQKKVPFSKIGRIQKKPVPTAADIIVD